MIEHMDYWFCCIFQKVGKEQYTQRIYARSLEQVNIVYVHCSHSLYNCADTDPDQNILLHQTPTFLTLDLD